jgi:LysR family transcriptional regulator, regulator for metE and metH
MPLSPNQIRLVHHVAREGTLSGAAQALCLTQSALSHQLAKLERQIRTAVFIRTGKRMVPTSAGRLILERGQSILEAMLDLDGELAAIARGHRGTIRLTASCFTCYHWLPEVLPQFRQSWPDVEIRLVPEHSGRALDALDEGALDLVLTYEPLGEDPRLDALPIFEDEQVLVVAPDHRLAANAFVEAEDLADEHLFLHYGPPETSLFIRTVMMPAGVRPGRISEVRLTEAILGLVAAGVGAAVVTRWTAAPEIASGRVVALRIGRSGLIREWKAVRLSGEDSPAYLDEFRGLLRLGPARLFERPERERERSEAGITLTTGDRR